MVDVVAAPLRRDAWRRLVGGCAWLLQVAASLQYGEEALDYRVDLLGHLQLAEVARSHGLAVQYLRGQLVEAGHVRARLELVGRYVDRRHRQAPGHLGGVVVAQALEGRHHNVLGDGRHAL